MDIKKTLKSLENYLAVGTSLSIIYTIAFHLQTFYMMVRIYNTTPFSSQWLGIFSELIIALSCTSILFAISWPSHYLRTIIIPISFLFGSASAYFSIELNRLLTSDLIRDFFNVENDLTLELITPQLIAAISASLIASLLLLKYSSLIIKFYKRNKPYRIFVLFCIAISISSVILDMSFRSQHLTSASKNYMPFSFFVHLGKYALQTKKFSEANNHKLDLSKEFSWYYNQPEPMTVVFVIGESLRADKLSLNGFKTNTTPNLSSEQNLISFPNFWSLYGTTKYAIPTMMTRLSSIDPELPINEKSFISIYKALGFQTAWIGIQGIYGQYDHTYGSIALEASTVIEKSDIKAGIDNKKYDEYLLPIAEQFLQEQAHTNNLLVFHMIGSHWPFDKRYPDKFRVLQPSCTGSASNCSDIEITNSYNNSILYSDWVLGQLINMLKDRNAILIFSSDHGISLKEDGAFGAESLTNHKSLNVATFIWFSNRYAQKNPLKIEKLRLMRNERHTHQNLFHTILGCSNIESDAITARLNLCK